MTDLVAVLTEPRPKEDIEAAWQDSIGVFFLRVASKYDV